MDVATDLPADAQAVEPAQQADRLLDDVAARARTEAAPGDDALGLHQAAVFVMVIAAIGMPLHIALHSRFAAAFRCC
ncbi:hypothetical protein [Actinomadura kijaniata]|uniref:hypothetical protein n=1 Tax=Actinomadura kijaniata TaxID=46161 RepID=UPI0012FCD096|nr:hypothetical protein [Actinomadura kijaniata]